MKKDRAELSVIVPVYNEENRIKICIESILKQSYPYFELILVDDGSSDDSGLVCDEYAKSDNRIKVIHIDNVGPFQARKAGAEKAKGSILTFSDSDDWLEPDAFEIIMQIHQSYGAEIIAYTYFYEDNVGEKNLYQEKLYLKSEIREKIIPGMMFDFPMGMRRLNPSLCCKFIQRDLYMKVTETVKDRITLGEDAMVTYPAVCLAQSLFIYNKPLYHYRNNSSSCTHKFPLQRVDEVRKFQDNMMRLFYEMDMQDVMWHQVESYLRTFISMMIKNWYGIELSAVSFSIPDGMIPKGANVFIYGAGNVGKSYMNELKIKQTAHIVGWADRNYKKLPEYHNEKVIAPELIQEQVFDILLIAINDEEVAYRVKKDLIGMGVAENKIAWMPPIRIM